MSTLLTKWTLALTGVCCAFAASADPVGTWKTYDIHEPSRANAIVKVAVENGNYVARVVKIIYPGATDNMCRADHCEGQYKGKDLTGAAVFWGFKPAGDNKYKGGIARDLQFDKTYAATITDEGNHLRLTAGIKVPLVGVVGKSTVWDRM